MSIPIHRLSKQELIWMNKHFCKEHKHTFISHYQCYLKENPHQEKIGFLDIEASNLDANFGVMLSWCIKIKNGSIISDVLDKNDFKGKSEFHVDKRIVKNLVNAISGFDRLVGHYSKKFDIPFIRSRALINKIEFPSFGSIAHDDTYYMAKFKLKLNSNRLESVARALLGNSEKTHLDGATWIAASRGNKKALNYILKHNKIDVIELEKVWNILKDFVGKKNTSI